MKMVCNGDLSFTSVERRGRKLDGVHSLKKKNPIKPIVGHNVVDFCSAELYLKDTEHVS